MSDLQPIEAADLAMALSMEDDAGAWHLIVTPTPGMTAAAVRGAMRAADATVVELDATSGPQVLAKRLPNHGAALATGLDGWTPAMFEHFDVLREMIRAAHPVLVLVVTEQTAMELARHAPQCNSYFAGTQRQWERAVATPERKAAILADLRRYWRMTDGEVLEAALAGQLPRDADFATWLVLLEREDLLPPARPA